MNLLLPLPQGTWQTLKVLRDTPSGLFLGRNEHEAILLPGKYIPKGARPGDELRVFIYKDSEGRPVCTTRKPFAEVNQFAALEVVSRTEVGAFLDWGLEKDLFLPRREEKYEVQPGELVVVYIYIDEHTGRLACTMKLFPYFEKPGKPDSEQETEALIFGVHRDHYEAVVRGNHYARLARQSSGVPLKLGDRVLAHIAKVQGDTLILSLNRQQGTEAGGTQMILSALRQAGGFLPYHDKTDPAVLLRVFGMSKKVFKKNIGVLYRERLISIENTGIRIV
jgi:predicted RNA-binding protein (virulence factor B family)